MERICMKGMSGYMIVEIYNDTNFERDIRVLEGGAVRERFALIPWETRIVEFNPNPIMRGIGLDDFGGCPVTRDRYTVTELQICIREDWVKRYKNIIEPPIPYYGRRWTGCRYDY
jgi:hypothetical protein